MSGLKPYILKAKKFAEPPFQSKKQSAEKVRKSRHKNFATKVRKSFKSPKNVAEK